MFYPPVFQRKLSQTMRIKEHNKITTFFLKSEITIKELINLLLATTDLDGSVCRYHCCIGATGVQLLICRYCVDTV